MGIVNEQQPSMESIFPENGAPDAEESQEPVQWTERMAHLLRDKARIAGSAGLILITLLMAWDVIYGQNGLSAWSAKRSHDRQLTQEIQRLQQENGDLSKRIERLRDDPAAIEFQARQSLHYARPNEVIYALPAAQQTPSQGSDSAPGESH